MEGSSSISKPLLLSYTYVCIASHPNFHLVALCRSSVNIIYSGDHLLSRHITFHDTSATRDVMELNLLSSCVLHSNLNWPLLPWLWWLHKYMAHSQHLWIQLWHGFLKITHWLMEAGFLPNAEETQGFRWKGCFWSDWSLFSSPLQVVCINFAPKNIPAFLCSAASTTVETISMISPYLVIVYPQNQDAINSISMSTTYLESFGADLS